VFVGHDSKELCLASFGYDSKELCLSGRITFVGHDSKELCLRTWLHVIRVFFARRCQALELEELKQALAKKEIDELQPRHWCGFLARWGMGVGRGRWGNPGWGSPLRIPEFYVPGGINKNCVSDTILNNYAEVTCVSDTMVTHCVL
jgi:hypothetical protein